MQADYRSSGTDRLQSKIDCRRLQSAKTTPFWQTADDPKECRELGFCFFFIWLQSCKTASFRRLHDYRQACDCRQSGRVYISASIAYFCTTIWLQLLGVKVGPNCLLPIACVSVLYNWGHFYRSNMWTWIHDSVCDSVHGNGCGRYPHTQKVFGLDLLTSDNLTTYINRKIYDVLKDIFSRF